MSLFSITCYYDKVIPWIKALFCLPSGKSDRAFVSELRHLFRAYIIMLLVLPWNV